jgi:cytoskeletal protein RodZ
MRRFRGIRTPFLVGVLGAPLLVLALGACSSDKKATPPATSAPATSATSTEPEASSSTSSPETTTVPTTATTGAPTTRTTPAASGVRISGYTVSPASPVCNSPTEIQLSWTAAGAATVDLAIDGQKFASYPGGAQTHLEYFACDGKAHTYLLTARGARGGVATATKVVRATATG